ncbi:MAG: S9 family peptidase, partial [Myxococcota bacterium]
MTAHAPLIPRHVLFDNPERAGVSISPNGAYLAYLAPLEGVLNVWVAPLETPRDASPITRDTGRGIRSFMWTYAPDTLVFIQDRDGDENWHLYAASVTGDAVRDLTDVEGVQARIVHASPEEPHHLLIALNDRDPRLHDIHRLDLRTGERELVLENHGFVGYSLDQQGNIRFAHRMLPSGAKEILPVSAGGTIGAEPFATVAHEDSLTTHGLGFDLSGDTFRMLDSRGRDTAALVEVEVATGEKTVVWSTDKADVSNLLIHPETKEVQAVGYTFDRRAWHFFDEQAKQRYDAIAAAEDAGECVIVSRTLDDSKWIAAITRDDGPVRYYLQDEGTGDVTCLFTNRPSLEDVALVPMHPVVIKSRDGLDLVSYLSMPPGAGTTRETYIPDAPVPMVLFVHGGPWARDTYGFNPYHQWLANRGYAVLSVNFRGSTGFGKSFVNAGDGEWGAKMHDDLIDAVRWAVDRGVALEDRVAIMGGSYGGYATLVGLTCTPEVFACGVDIVGPSSIKTLIESVPPYWEPLVAQFHKRVGDPNTPQGKALMEERSPLNHVEHIQRPLLIGQGANDPRVKQAESDQIVQAMKERSIPVTYVLYPDEGHGWARPENSKSF